MQDKDLPRCPVRYRGAASFLEMTTIETEFGKIIISPSASYRSGDAAGMLFDVEFTSKDGAIYEGERFRTPSSRCIPELGMLKYTCMQTESRPKHTDSYAILAWDKTTEYKLLPIDVAGYIARLRNARFRAESLAHELERTRKYHMRRNTELAARCKELEDRLAAT